MWFDNMLPGQPGRGEEGRGHGGLVYLLPLRALSRGGLKHPCARSSGTEHGKAFSRAFCIGQLETSLGRQRTGLLEEAVSELNLQSWARVFQTGSR